jgi:hypothetical protein
MARRRRWLSAILAAALLLTPVQPARAWNGFGHRVVAAIAFAQLDPTERAKVSRLLSSHPAAADPFWLQHDDNGPDPALNLFMNASIFPDDVRGRGPFNVYHISRAHYVNWQVRADQGGQVLDPAQEPGDDDPHRDVLKSLETNVATVKSASASPADKSIALSWIFHQVGDLHQPLHTVARFSSALPGGDRGGNQVRVPGGNLHGFWDGVLGRDQAPANVIDTARSLTAEHPRASFGPELAKGPTDFTSFGKEGADLAVKVVYRNLPAEQVQFVDFPIGYQADAASTARRQATLAGYRMADLLRELIAATPD